MLLKRLTLRHFRNYEEATIDFAPSINAVCGANAQGKTSLLEAIYLCVSGRSFRTPHIADLQQTNQPFFSVEVWFTKSGVDQRLRYTYDGKERRILYNATPCQSTAQLLGILPGVVMVPDDIALIKGSPQIRRQYLDMQISQANPLYLHHLVRYQRAMRQRNQLLRQQSLQTIEPWEEEMAASAAYIVAQRGLAVNDLSTRASESYSSLTQENEPLALKYKSGAPTDQEPPQVIAYYRERLQQQRRRDVELGWTSVGPHKDDLLIGIQGKLGRFFASEGQQRSAVVAMRMAEWQRLRNQVGCSPLLIIDDVAMSLDNDRRERLLGSLKGMGQVFLSSAQDLQPILANTPTRFIYIAAGKIQRTI